MFGIEEELQYKLDIETRALEMVMRYTRYEPESICDDHCDFNNDYCKNHCEDGAIACLRHWAEIEVLNESRKIFGLKEIDSL